MGKLGRTGRKRQLRRETNRIFQSAFDDKHIALMKWAKINGVQFGKVKPAVFADTGRGLMACKKLKKGDCIVSVPEKLLITTKTVEQNQVARFFARFTSNSKLSTRQKLCIFLLHERFCGQDSFWFPYISTLPETFSTACYFDTCEMEVLPEAYYQLYNEQRRAVTREYQEVLQLLGDNLHNMDPLTGKLFTLENYRWAWCVVNTRSVYMPRNDHRGCQMSIKSENFGFHRHLHGEESSYALAPVLDLLNHMDTAEVEAGLCPATGRYEIHTLTEYCKGSQVFINYGPHDNKTLLVEYGFVLPSNIHNIVPVDHMRVYSLVSKSDSVSMRDKLGIIERNKLDKDFSISKNCGVSWSLLVSLRILAMKREELKFWQKALSGNSISDKNEGKVLKWMEDLLKQTLGAYRTTVEEDQSLIKQASCSENVRLALQLLMQEKLILQEALKRF